MNYVFDVDGTLTPSRGKIDQDFEKFFYSFAQRNDVYLVTGSDYEKTLEQVGSRILKSVRASYNCSGNSVYVNGELTWKNQWTLPDHMVKYCLDRVRQSKFYAKTGNHVEQRIGLANWSIVGRNASLENRAMYKQWDEHKLERETLAREFNAEFKSEGVVAQVAGETGLDIVQVGADKSQIADWLTGPISFFGDKTEKGGNDYPLALALVERPHCKTYPVKDWIDTQRILYAIEFEDVHSHVGVV